MRGPQQKVNPLFKGKNSPGRRRECMCLVFVGCFTWINIGGIIALSCNSVYSEICRFFFLLVVVVLINEVDFHNPNNPSNFDRHTPMLCQKSS